ncbi:MAG: cytochrome c oxidase assembly protein [Actinomycetota bacterium]|nr:cytochrome c oxidase assembly protein [Actinomycetota bacterium]
MSRTTAERSTTRPPMGFGGITLLATSLVVLAVSALGVSLMVSGGAYEPPSVGLPDPGPLVVWGAPILRLLTDIAALTTIGWLLAASILDPAGKDGVLSRVGRVDALRASIAALIWSALALVQMFFVLANILGITLSQAFNPAIFATYASDIPATRALMVMALLAFVVAFGAFFTSTIGAEAGWLLVALVAVSLPVLGGHGAGLGDHALAITAGVAHVLAAVIWIGGLMALALHAVRRDGSVQRSLQRFSTIALVAIVLLAVSGVTNAYTRLDSISQLFSTGYGQLILAKALIIIGLGIIGYLMRGRIIAGDNKASGVSIFARIAGLELTIMVIAVAMGVSLASSAPPRLQTAFNSFGETLLGSAYPPPPTVLTVGLGFRLEPLFLTLGIVGAALYCIGVARLRARGDKWPWGRLVAWLLGIGIMIWCTNAGIATYSQVSVGLHMFQHMTMTMLAPIMLVLGAPATLALRALKPSHGTERGPREWLTWFLHSWITSVLTNPFYVFVIYVLGLYGLYMTPLFGWLMGSHTGHVVMQLHFLAAGYLFYWVLIGIDPRPKPLPYWGRLLMLMLALSVHGFFAVAMMMSSTPLAPEWYGVVQPDWIVDPLRDTLIGAQVAWGLSEVPTLIVLIAIAVQWSRSDEREARRSDRQADRDGEAKLNEYNERFARLSGNDKQG